LADGQTDERSPLDAAREEFERIAPGGAPRYTNAQRLEDAVRAVVRDELQQSVDREMSS
jgi:hypothetical protein